MRTPVRSETDAFRIAYGVAALIGVSVLLGLIAGPVAGAILFTLGAVAALVWDVRTQDSERRLPLREAAVAQHPGATPGAWKILVIANETLAGEQLREELLRRAKLDPELIVIAPILPSRMHLITSDIDREMAEAQRRLDDTVTWAAGHGFKVWGEVGNTHPLTAVEDGLRRFGADEVIISTHPAGKSNWLESGVVDRVRAELDVPVTHVVVDRSAQSIQVVA